MPTFLQTSASRTTPSISLPPLENGDRLDQKTFHSRYEAMPEHVKAELIGGIVYMASPMNLPHARSQPLLIRWLDEYAEATPGTEALENATVIMGPKSEPQPDACLILAADRGGQVRENKQRYFVGAPELGAEISYSTESIDLNAKKTDYEKSGMLEYLVVALQKKVFWFTRQRGKFKEMKPGPDGILRSKVFPGLWLDPAAFLSLDRKRLLEVLHMGLATPEHAAFLVKLAKMSKR